MTFQMMLCLSSSSKAKANMPVEAPQEYIKQEKHVYTV